MATLGMVQEYWPDDGWGVVVSHETPGGCWVQFSAIEVEGFRQLAAGEPVLFEWEPATQDGYAFRATRCWPVGAEPAGRGVHVTGPSDAYGSTLLINGRIVHLPDAEG